MALLVRILRAITDVVCAFAGLFWTNVSVTNRLIVQAGEVNDSICFITICCRRCPHANTTYCRTFYVKYAYDISVDELPTKSEKAWYIAYKDVRWVPWYLKKHIADYGFSSNLRSLDGELRYKTHQSTWCDDENNFLGRMFRKRLFIDNGYQTSMVCHRCDVKPRCSPCSFFQTADLYLRAHASWWNLQWRSSYSPF